MKLTYEITNIDEFKAWSGAVPTRNAIIENHKQDEFMMILDDIFPDGCSETELNDFFGLMMSSSFLHLILNRKNKHIKNNPALLIQDRVYLYL